MRDLTGAQNINMTSPITIFVRTAKGELKVVAIQQDYKPSKYGITINVFNINGSHAMCASMQVRGRATEGVCVCAILS